jgi:hypothetical protein
VIDAPRLQRRPMLESTKPLDPEASAVAVKSALPAYLDGDVRLFNFAEEGINSHTLEWFFAIQCELMKDWNARECKDNHFLCNRANILDAFVKGNLYGLCMPETQTMQHNVTPEDPNFMTGMFTGRTRYRFPVFCAVDNDRIDLLWVAERMRRKGLATLLVSLLKQRGVSGADYIDCVPGALLFWERVGTVSGPPGLAQVHF